jgi:hypothetical protein
MEQIVILILFVVASIVSSIVQNRKKRQETDRQGLPPSAPRRPFEQWPQTTADWQEELRRLLEPDKQQPPPVIVTAPPPIVPRPRQQAAPVERSEGDEAIGATGKFRERVHEFMHTGHRHAGGPAEKPPRAPVLRQTKVSPRPFNWARNPQRVREAFVASLIFSPPPGLERR